jgi:glycosyltransferase involved in cell wall biosynthesis
MKILSLTPGTGGTFYCQNCLRDGQMVRALHRRGHDVTVVPLYLPILLDSEELNAETGVFFGGVNVFLQQNVGIFRSTPRWLDKLFDSAWMLRKAASREGSTRAVDLGPMTYSMLQGRDGLQRKELDRLLDWLKEQPKPDVVHISNALLLGLVGEIKKALRVPVVCNLQDEDTFLDAMTPEWRDKCWAIIAEKARDVDVFIAVSRWYAEKMALRMKTPPGRIRVVPLGIEWESVEPATLDFERPVLGFLSRIHPSQGFSALVEAFIELKRDPRLKHLRLRATGGITSGDHDYVKEVMAKLKAAGVADDVEIVEEFNRAARQEFVRSITVLSVPAPEGEAFGMFILEAGACGVPVVQPDAGAFREVIEMTGGGIVYNPKDPRGLFESLRQLLLDPEQARRLGNNARNTVKERFMSSAMAANMEAVLSELVPSASSVQAETVGVSRTAR